MKKYNSNGKLLLTSEYLVLDGSKALAIPTRFGQDLIVEKIKETSLIWESFDVARNCWFQAEFRLPDLRIVNETFDTNSEDSKESIAQTLQKILLVAKKMNPDFLVSEEGFLVKTNLTFPRDWGLGTSSTLINNIAQWANVDAFELLQNSFGGSGYDIACAQNDLPISYQLDMTSFRKLSEPLSHRTPKVEIVEFNPSFTDQLFFVHLNSKQDSKKGIQRYKELKGKLAEEIKRVSEITDEMIACKSISEFEKLIVEHEEIISKIIQNKPIKEILFADYFGAIKSLGAWGGDFVLVTGNENTSAYFKQKGFDTVIPYKEMIL
ncbi:MAG: GHMP kinase [Flavobacteriaceae bacterium]|nr:MAG: GHMP kinase [Flavobacteriaceae bacterium]